MASENFTPTDADRITAALLTNSHFTAKLFNHDAVASPTSPRVIKILQSDDKIMENVITIYEKYLEAL